MANGQVYKNAHDRIEGALVAHLDDGDYAKLGMVLREFGDEVLLGLWSAEVAATAAYAQEIVSSRDV